LITILKLKAEFLSSIFKELMYYFVYLAVICMADRTDGNEQIITLKKLSQL